MLFDQSIPNIHVAVLNMAFTELFVTDVLHRVHIFSLVIITYRYFSCLYVTTIHL